jgi:hypothetical protein
MPLRALEIELANRNRIKKNQPVPSNSNGSGINRFSESFESIKDQA